MRRPRLSPPPSPSQNRDTKKDSSAVKMLSPAGLAAIPAKPPLKTMAGDLAISPLSAPTEYWETPPGRPRFET